MSPSFLPSFFPSPPQPLLSSQELEKTQAIVKEFGREGGAGERLQQALLEKTNSNDSWVGAGREGCGGRIGKGMMDEGESRWKEMVWSTSGEKVIVPSHLRCVKDRVRNVPHYDMRKCFEK